MKNYILLIALLAFSRLSCAGDLIDMPKSGESDNGFGVAIAGIGVNKSEAAITGYYRLYNPSMPNRGFHADCIIVFGGKLSGGSAFDILAKNVAAPTSKAVGGKLVFEGSQSYGSGRKSEQLYRIVFHENIAGCSSDVDLSGSDFQFGTNKFGDWEKISAIQAKKAYFYSEPSDSTEQKAYLVASDIIHVYEQKPGWYYVRFQGPKKETVGWIKKSETVDLDSYRSRIQ